MRVVRSEERPSPRVWRWVVLAAVVCFCSTSWGFSRDVGAHRLVDVHPGQTLLSLLLFVLIGIAARRDPERAKRVIGVVAAVIVLLTAVVLPIVINRAIDAGHPAGAWPMDWLVPVRLHFRNW